MERGRRAVIKSPLRAWRGDLGVRLTPPAQSERQISASMKTFSSQWDITTGQIERIV
jgi:hypothetical protein